MTAPDEPLKRCPRCGSTEAQIVERDVEPQGDSWYGRRDELFIQCPCGIVLFDENWHEGFMDAAAAIAAWNRRAGETT